MKRLLTWAAGASVAALLLFWAPDALAQATNFVVNMCPNSTTGVLQVCNGTTDKGIPTSASSSGPTSTVSINQTTPGTTNGVVVNSGTITAISPVMTYQGTLALSAATSTAVSTLTLSNSTTFPATIGRMVVINTGTNAANLCWFGGTCSAAAGSEPLAAGASDTIYLGAATISPTAFSTAGTTLAVHN